MHVLRVRDILRRRVPSGCVTLPFSLRGWCHLLFSSPPLFFAFQVEPFGNARTSSRSVAGLGNVLPRQPTAPLPCRPTRPRPPLPRPLEIVPTPPPPLLPLLHFLHVFRLANRILASPFSLRNDRLGQALGPAGPGMDAPRGEVKRAPGDIRVSTARSFLVPFLLLPARLLYHTPNLGDGVESPPPHALDAPGHLRLQGQVSTRRWLTSGSLPEGFGPFMLGKSSWGSFWLAGSDALGESGAELEQQYRGGGKGAQDGGGGGWYE